MTISQVGDVTIIAPLSVPNDAAAAVRAASVLGGYVACVDTAERDLIPTSSRKAGLLARTDAGVFYLLGSGLTNSDWAVASFGTSDIASVAAAATGNITLSGIQTIDGVATPASVLVPNQTDATQNGIYVPAAGAWVRRSDIDASSEFRPGIGFLIAGGTVNGGKLAFYVGPTNPTIGTTSLPFALSFATPVNVTDDNKVAVASGGALTYALLVNANVASAAAIAGSKIAPQFGAQGLTLTDGGFIGFGTVPALSGDFRYRHGTTWKGRNSGNAGDTTFLDYGVAIADSLVVGGVNCGLYLTSAGSVNLVSGTTPVMSVFSTKVDLGSTLTAFNAGTNFTFGVADVTGPGGAGFSAAYKASDCSGNASTGGATTCRGGNSTGTGATIGGAITVRPGSGATGGLGTLATGAGTSRIGWNDTGLGFFAATPVAKPTITGSRGANAALADLLTKLAALGLITDSTT